MSSKGLYTVWKNILRIHIGCERIYSEYTLVTTPRTRQKVGVVCKWPSVSPPPTTTYSHVSRPPGKFWVYRTRKLVSWKQRHMTTTPVSNTELGTTTGVLQVHKCRSSPEGPELVKTCHQVYRYWYSFPCNLGHINSENRSRHVCHNLF